MVRPLLSDGTRYPRKRPVNWDVVRRVLRARQDRRDAKADGFVEVRSWSNLPWDDQLGRTRIVATRISRDQRTLFVKIIEQAPEHPALAGPTHSTPGVVGPSIPKDTTNV